MMRTSDVGTLIIEQISNGSFIRDTAMEITNLGFHKRKGKLWTFLSNATPKAVSRWVSKSGGYEAPP